MARPIKEGLDYFSLDCHIDDKLKLIQAEFGLKGFAVVVKLFQKIYGEFGYYCEWNEDVLLLFMSENGLTSDKKNLINQIVSACIKRDIFSQDMYEMYGILTSAGIQNRYLVATAERVQVKLKKEYLLVSVPKNRVNLSINGVSRSRNSINRSRNTQSKVKESKLNIIKDNIYVQNEFERESKKPAKKQVDDFFESIWKLYPKKRGKGQVSDAKKRKLYDIGFDEISKAIKRYKSEVDDIKYMQNGSTFFNSGYIDYLDENYEPKASGKKQTFEQRNYDYDELERELIANRNKKRGDQNVL